MTESPFQTFIDFITFDREIVALEAQLNTIAHQIHTLKQQDYAVRHEQEVAKQQVHDAQKEVDAQELEMKSLDQQEAEKKSRLENVTNHKEYQSIKAELERVKTKQHDLEQILLQAWNALESSKKSYDHKVAESAKSLEQFQQELQTKEGEKADLMARINSLMQQRPEKEKAVPAEWLEKYAAMRSRVANPVVPVVNGNCSACFYKVSEQDMMMLNRNKLLQCKDCYRFLYIQKPT